MGIDRLWSRQTIKPNLAMANDKVHALLAMIVGFALGCAMIYAAGGQPLAVMRPSTDMAVLQPAVASQSKFMSPVKSVRARMQPLRASMPQPEEHAVSKGRREVMANVAGAAALGLGLSATKHARAEDEVPADAYADNAGVEPTPPPPPPNRLAFLAVAPATALGWVGFNILGPAFNQLGSMAEQKEQLKGGAPAKKRR